MKIGYPCINRSIECAGNSTFRLKNYSEERLFETLGNNLECLKRMIDYNTENRLLFFRISSGLVPFASHEVCCTDWAKPFRHTFRELEESIKAADIRISMHPDQFVLINAIRPDVVDAGIRELVYHAQLLDALGLGSDAKLQIHVGGVYGDKDASIARFIERYHNLPDPVRTRLVVENDDRSFTVRDCVRIHEFTGIPVLFDWFHHELNNEGESGEEAIELSTATWSETDGVPMVDYSSQAMGERSGKHTESIDLRKFGKFLRALGRHDADIMLEIKDKEKSAIRARDYVEGAGLGRK